MISKEIEKYLIEKDKNKTDMVSSLKRIDKKVMKKILKENCADNIEELAKDVIEMFSDTLDFSKSDMATKMFFKD